LSPSLDFNDIITAINEYWLPIEAKLAAEVDISLKAQIALSIYVWRCKNEHRIKFFSELATGEPRNKNKLIKLLDIIESHQKECDSQVTNLISSESELLAKWILDYCNECLSQTKWERQIDGIDNCVRLIERYKYFFGTDSTKHKFDDVLSKIQTTDINITSRIRNALSSLLTLKKTSTVELLNTFEERCAALPTNNLTLVLERLLGTNVPIGEVLNSTQESNSVHESIPYDCLKSILTSIYYNPAESFLDLGSGSGTLAIALKLFSNANVTGVEIVPELVAISRKASIRLNSKVNFINQDATKTDFSNFQNIIIFSTINGKPLEVIMKNILNTSSVKRIWTIGFVSSKFKDIGWDLLTPESSKELDLHIFERN
jgi:hypothetical protein